MNFSFSVENFRGFHRRQAVRISPITILVGENSAGKSSFLSAVNYSLDFLSQRAEPSFNKEPFQLGTYDQIAHFRGGQAGRATSFSLEIRCNLSVAEMREFSINGQFDVILKLKFSKFEEKAILTEIHISNENDTLTLTTRDEKINYYLKVVGQQQINITDYLFFNKSLKADFVRAVSFATQSIRFQFRRSQEIQALGEKFVSTAVRLAELLEALMMSTPHVTEASSPMRTSPKRTYTPGAEAADGEGTHVPFQIARKFRRRTSERGDWESLKTSIENFGQSSGMFKSLSVRSLGQSSSDPFQLQFSSGGPKANIVDLGYGTSQVLPILYSLATSEPNGVFLIQQPEVHLHAKAQVALSEYFLDYKIKKNYNFVIETHSDFILDRIRNGIRDKKITNRDVSILFFERYRLENVVTQIELDENGDVFDAPDSYRKFFIDEQMQLLGIR